MNYAKHQGKRSAVITFKDHPCCYFWGVCPKYILTRTDRRKYIEQLGIDYLYELDFEEIANLSAAEYLENILIKYFSPIAISTGFNHYFGAKKSGDTKFLKDNSSKYNYEYFILKPEMVEDKIISSTEIRKLLSEGKIKNANKMLGYNFQISGKIIEGQKLGRQIGFRTANMIYPQELIDLPFGVYATNAYIGNRKYKAITNFGIRPTVSSKNICTVETHILEFNEDIYGENIQVEFIDMIRKEQNFSSVDILKSQIKKDIETRKI